MTPIAGAVTVSPRRYLRGREGGQKITNRERLQQEWSVLIDGDDSWAAVTRRRMEELGVTQEALARAINVPLARISRHLRGVGQPKFEEAVAIARALAYWPKLAYLTLPQMAEAGNPKPSPQGLRLVA